jgi:heavy metal sensor kinase
MAESLRVRLLGWYAAIVMLVIAMVGVAVCWVTWTSRLSVVDTELRARAAGIALAVRPGPGNRFDVELPAELTAYFQRPGTYYAVWRTDGALVDRSDPDLAAARPAGQGAATRGNRREVVVQGGTLTILTGRDVSDVWQELWSLAATMLTVALVGIAAAVLVASSLAGRALAPVKRINETARRMAAGELTARIAVDRTDTELNQVALALNLAFDRQLESIERQRRFTADASHQLRTPLTLMLAELDWALLRQRSGEDYRESLATCRRAAQRMQAMVEGLLTLARAESGELAIGRDEVRLDVVADEVVGLLQPLAAQRSVTLQASTSPAAVAGDRDRLHDLISNLVFNALIYNRPDGTVSVEVRADETSVMLTVCDSGMGIEADDLPRIFDRFHRSEQARAREPGGAGLGLALSRWIVDAHGGAIACASEPGRRTEMVVRLPRAAQAAAAAGDGRRSATLIRPPATPSASTASVTPGDQSGVSPSAASSEYAPKPVSASAAAAVPYNSGTS